MTTKLGLEIAGKTDVGCVRKNNEDSIAVDEDLGLMVVADGMGGHNSGEVASSITTSTILEYAQKMRGGDKVVVPEGGDPALTPRGRQIDYFVRTANTLIFEKGRAFPKDAGMGTTVVAVIATAESLTVGHVGDSRLYLFRGGELLQLTEDHSLVTDQLKNGLISTDDAAKSNLQNILTRALGAEEKVKVDVAEHPLFPKDQILLCSDGLDKMVTNEEIAKVLADKGTALEKVDKLIEMSRAEGGVDNVTVIVAKVHRKPAGILSGLMSSLFGR